MPDPSRKYQARSRMGYYKLPPRTIEDLKKFWELLKKYRGVAFRAMMELRPDFSKMTAEVTAHRYINYLDPLEIIIPRRKNRKNMSEAELQIERVNYKKQNAVARAEEQQKLFEALFEKYGGGGIKAAALAVEEMFPKYKQRHLVLNKARLFLSRSPFTKDLITALEARGVDANMLADKIKELLAAKQKTTFYTDTGEGGKPTVKQVEKTDINAIDKGLTHALKAGAGGGYAPEKSLIGIKDFSLKNLLDEVEKEEGQRNFRPPENNKVKKPADGA